MQRTLLLLTALAGSAFAGDTTVDFESGAEGWTGPVVVNPTAGNGGGAGLQAFVQATGIHFTNSTSPDFLGDYGQYSQVTLSIDVIVHQISFFGTPAPRPWLVELRDYDSAQGGYPWASVWFKFDDISAAQNANWQTYSVTITDTSSTTLPAGWGGYGAEDPQTFEPILPAGVTFADILAGVDEVSFTTFEPGFFFGFTDFDVVVDNVSINCGPWTDLGGGTPGSNGTPTLVGFGDLTPGTIFGLELTNGPSSAPILLWIASPSTPFHALGGTVHAFPFVDQILLGTDPSGGLLASTTWPGAPSGTSIWFQYLCADGASPFGITLSNGVKGTVP